VGAFDLSVSFNPAVLSATGVTFGSLLGDPLLFEALTGSLIFSGSVDFFEVSLLTPAELDALQTVSFTLATLSFNAVGLGTTGLSFVPGVAGFAVSDGFGDPLSITANDGSVDVVAPEPGTLLLLGAGLGVLAIRARTGCIKQLRLGAKMAKTACCARGSVSALRVYSRAIDHSVSGLITVIPSVRATSASVMSATIMASSPTRRCPDKATAS